MIRNIQIQMIILGIETSCDETAVAVVDDNRNVLSHLVLSQIDIHCLTGGVVPEVAARAHLDHLDRLILEAMKQADLNFSDLDGVAATCGPGLIGGVMVGMMAAKSVALAHSKPFIAVNHLEAHALTPRLIRHIPFPYLVLLVSGGHTQILLAQDIGRYQLWATTRDDAVGECFDKSAKMMGLPYPGGPHLEKLAAQCDDLSLARARYPLAIPMQYSKDLAFSFSGLKTAVRQIIDRESGAEDTLNRAYLAAALQDVIAQTLSLRATQAMEKFIAAGYTTHLPHGVPPALIVCGGVSANMAIRSALERAAQSQGFELMAPPLQYCTDNGAMIAWAGVELLKAGRTAPLNFKARPRWPLEEL